VCAQTDPVALLKDLISIPSINPAMGDYVDSELTGEARVAEYLYGFVKSIGLDPLVQTTELSGRGNVGAVLYRGSQYKTVIFQCHMDTVDIDGDMGLLRPQEKDGKIFGRGACDDKGGLAAMFAALADAAAEPQAIANNVIVLGVSDDERGGAGCLAFLAQEPTRDADFGIVGEPTECRIVNGGKGVARWDIVVQGKSCHSSEPEKGINAIYRMGRILGAIEAYQERLGGFDDGPLGPETVSVGRIQGGTSVNVVPASCRIEVDRRLTRLFDSQRARTDLDEFLQQKGINFPYTFSALTTDRLASLIDEDMEELQVVQSVCARLGLDSSLSQVAYGSDALRMNAANVPSMLWGPGSINEAHSAHEHIAIDDLITARDFYLALMRQDLRQH